MLPGCASRMKLRLLRDRLEACGFAPTPFRLRLACSWCSVSVLVLPAGADFVVTVLRCAPPRSLSHSSGTHNPRKLYVRSRRTFIATDVADTFAQRSRAETLLRFAQPDLWPVMAGCSLSGSVGVGTSRAAIRIRLGRRPLPPRSTLVVYCWRDLGREVREETARGSRSGPAGPSSEPIGGAQRLGEHGTEGGMRTGCRNRTRERHCGGL